MGGVCIFHPKKMKPDAREGKCQAKRDENVGKIIGAKMKMSSTV